MRRHKHHFRPICRHFPKNAPYAEYQFAMYFIPHISIVVAVAVIIIIVVTIIIFVIMISDISDKQINVTSAQFAGVVVETPRIGSIG